MPPLEKRSTHQLATLQKLDEMRRQRLAETVDSVDFTYSSHKAWQVINKLSGRVSTRYTSWCPVTAYAIASQLLKNSRFMDATCRVVSLPSMVDGVNINFSYYFTIEELKKAISNLNLGKSHIQGSLFTRAKQQVGSVPSIPIFFLQVQAPVTIFLLYRNQTSR